MSGRRPLLCLVSRELTPPGEGGIGGAVRAQFERASADGLEAILLLDVPADFARRARRSLGVGRGPDASLHTVDELVPRALPAHAFRSEAYWRSFRIWRALEVLAARRPLDVVEFPDYEGLGFVSIKARRLGLGLERPRLVVRLHGTGELVAQAEQLAVHTPAVLQTYAMERYCLAHADALLAPSEAVLEAYRERYELAPRHLVSPPIVSLPAPAPARGRAPARTRPLRVLHFGKLQRVKGVEEVVAAALRVLERCGDDALELHLVGGDAPSPDGGSLRAELARRIPDELASRFVFHGRLPREQAFALAARCHLAVFASRMETFCLAAHELAALGIPLVLADLPAFRAWFAPDRDAFYFDGSADALAELLIGIVEGVRALPPSPPAPPVGKGAAALRALCTEPAPTRIEVREPPLVSVLMPYHEMHDYVDEAIASVEASTHPRWEIVLVDDGSRSAAARAAFARLERERAGDARFRFVRQANRGLGAARNAALAHAQGALVLPLDPDDLIHPDYLARAAAALARCPELGFVSCISSLFRDGAAPASAREWIVPYDPPLALLLFENGAGTAACVFRREILARHRYREDLPAYEDWDLQIALRQAGVRGECLPEVLHHYRIRAAGLAATRAHLEHDRLLARILEERLRSAPAELREALFVYLRQVSELRGLGPGALQLSGRRAALFGVARSAYHRWLKALLFAHLPERSRLRLTATAKRLLGGRPVGRSG